MARTSSLAERFEIGKVLLPSDGSLDPSP